MKAAILAGGRLRLDAALRQEVAACELVIAADGGLRHARALAVRPHLLVGDMDSVQAEDLARWPELRREQHPADKDALDVELAVEAARREGAQSLLLLGAFGGRLDQTLATLLIAVRYRHEGLHLTLADARHRAVPLIAGDAWRGGLADGTVFSVMPVAGDARVDVSEAAFPLAGGRLPAGRGLGLSNRAQRGGPQVQVHEGSLLVVVETPESASPARDLWGEDHDRIAASLQQVDPDLASLIQEVAYERIFARPGLDHRTRSLLAIAHLTQAGDTEALRTHLRALVRSGGSLQEGREAILHAAAFVGFPRALAAMRAWAQERDRD